MEFAVNDSSDTPDFLIGEEYVSFVASLTGPKGMFTHFFMMLLLLSTD